MEKKLFTREEAADRLSISVDTIDRMRASGKIKHVRIGSRVYFTPDEIDRFVSNLVKEAWMYA